LSSALPYREHGTHCNTRVPRYVLSSVVRNISGLAMVACPGLYHRAAPLFFHPAIKSISQCVLTVTSLGSSEPASLPQLSSNCELYVSVDHRQCQCNSGLWFHNISNMHVLYEMYTVMRRVTTGIRSEKCGVRQFHHRPNITECIYANLDSIAY